MRILVLSGSYLPTRRSGGTVRAIEGLVSALGDEHDIRVVTPDRDPGSNEPFAAVQSAGWQQVGKANVYYVPPHDLAPHRLSRIARAVGPDVYYVNSLLSPQFGIVPVMLRWSGAMPRRPLVLAPRGELHPAALGLKATKKRLFLAVATRSGAYRRVLWQAGSEAEAEDIRYRFGSDARVAVARDLAALDASGPVAARAKSAGAVSLACLARITPIKNIVGALRMLRHVRGDVEYVIYGPAAEPRYFETCQLVARSLPGNVRVRFAGELAHERVIGAMGSHHALFLPTLGESFGHAILESLLAGCMLVISDRTPWRGLQARGVGWDLPLEEETAFQNALRRCVEMGDAEFSERSERARALGRATLADRDAVDASRRLFDQARATGEG